MTATRSLSSSRKKKQPPPFYEVPISQTSAKIIAEARNSVRALPTDRPYTPAAHNRILFGHDSSQSRPPSAYSIIGAQHFSDDKLSRPATGQRLPPMIPSVVKSTPPTPVQSFQDLSICTAPVPIPPLTVPSFSCSQNHPSHVVDLPSGHESQDQSSSNVNLASSSSSLSAARTTTLISPATTMMVQRTEGVLDCVSVGLKESRELKPKQSLCSPVHSKRSLSAGTLKKIVSNELGHEGLSRVASAGDMKKKRMTPQLPLAGQTGTQQHGQEEGRTRRMKKGDQSESGTVVQSLECSSKSSTASLLSFWESEVAPLLQEMESTSYEEVKHLRTLCDSMWICLEGHGFLGRLGGVGGSKKRSMVLRTVFKLLDHKDPLVLLKVAKMIIAMEVTGKNLLNVCKLLFALGREESNDQHFRAEPVTGCLVEALLQVDLAAEQETMIYGLGTLKLLASCPELREQLASTTQVMSLLLNTLKLCIQPGRNINILIQLTGALRNLSDAPVLRETFSSTGLIPQLALVLSSHMDDEDIVFNISRLFSKLTLTSSCLAATLQSPSLLPLFLRALSVHAHHVDIVVRVCFILGNLTADDEDTRFLLYFQHLASQYLTPLLQQCVHLQLEQLAVSADTGRLPPLPTHRKDGGKKQPISKLGDVLIKLVRLIANLSVHPEVGPSIAMNQDTVSSLLTILESFPLNVYEELVVNCLGTLNNLSFYADVGSYLMLRQEELAAMLVRVMMVDSNAGLLEATRVCGNLSKYPAVRQLLIENKVDEVMVTLLDSDRRDMVFCACGVLVNLLVDSACRDNIAINGALRKLIEVLHDLGRGDWLLASLVCKTLWNYSEKLSSSVDCLGEQERLQLIHILTSYSDAFPAHSPPPESSHQLVARQSWQADFLPVAQALLERISTYNSMDSTQLAIHR